MGTEKTIAQLLASRVKRYGSRMAFQVKDGWSWKQLTWLDLDHDVKSTAAFLMSMGFERGDRVLVLYPNRKEVLWTEFAVSLLGGVSISLSEEDLPEYIEEVARRWGVKLIFSGDGEHLEKIKEVSSRLPELKKIVVYTAEPIRADGGVVAFSTLMKLGSVKRRSLGDELNLFAQGIEPGFEASIFIHPNGNGGVSATRLTHGDLLAAIEEASEKLSFLGEEGQAFSHLPSACPFSRFVNYIVIYMGLRVSVAETREDFYEDVLELKPTVIFKTKRGLKDVVSTILLNGHAEPSGAELKRALGGRVAHIVTDFEPGEDLLALFTKAGITITVLGEFAALLD
ncbi:MAG: AMP-binding protein [Thermodesulfobacteriota bacterium]